MMFEIIFFTLRGCLVGKKFFHAWKSWFFPFIAILYNYLYQLSLASNNGRGKDCFQFVVSNTAPGNNFVGKKHIGFQVVIFPLNLKKSYILPFNAVLQNQMHQIWQSRKNGWGLRRKLLSINQFVATSFSFFFFISIILNVGNKLVGKAHIGFLRSF